MPAQGARELPAGRVWFLMPVEGWCHWDGCRSQGQPGSGCLHCPSSPKTVLLLMNKTGFADERQPDGGPATAQCKGCAVGLDVPLWDGSAGVILL